MSTKVRWCRSCGQMHVSRAGVSIGCSGRAYGRGAHGRYEGGTVRVDWNGGHALLCEQEGALVKRLLLCSASWRELVGWLHDEREDGGPEWAWSGVRRML